MKTAKFYVIINLSETSREEAERRLENLAGSNDGSEALANAQILERQEEVSEQPA